MEYEIEAEEDLPSGWGAPAAQIPPLLAKPQSAFEVEEETPLPSSAMVQSPAIQNVKKTVESALTQAGTPTSALDELPEVVITPPKEDTRPKMKWSEMPREVGAAIGGRIENKIAGVKEYTGHRKKIRGEEEVWRAQNMARVIQEAGEKGITYPEHPDVVAKAKELGISPFNLIPADWARYANMTDEERAKTVAEGTLKAVRGALREKDGAERRNRVKQVGELYAMNTGSKWSPKSLAFDMATSIPDLLVGAAGTAATGGAGGLALMGATIMPEMMTQGRNAGLSNDQTLGYAGLMTAAELVTEIPVLEALSKTPAGKRAMRAVAGKYAETVGGRVVSVAALEAAGESMTEALQIGIDQGYFQKDISLGAALQQIARAGAVGAGVGAVVSAGSEGMSKGVEVARKPKTTKPTVETPTRKEPTIGELPEVSTAKEPTMPGETATQPDKKIQTPAAAAPVEKAADADIQKPERRKDTEERKRVEDMSPEELRASLLTNELSGMPNRRAYEDAPKKPVQASIDIDSLKYVNDNLGHPAGDALLKEAAKALRDEGIEAFHISGDEFVVQGDDEAAVREALGRASDRLKAANLELPLASGDRKIFSGMGLSYGIGKTLQEAEAGLHVSKAEREKSGERAARGEPPPAAIEVVESPRSRTTIELAGEGTRETSAQIEALEAVRDGKASPEQITQLASQKLIIQNETGVPRLLPAGRRLLAADPQTLQGTTSRGTEVGPARATEKPAGRTLDEPLQPAGEEAVLEGRQPPESVGRPTQGVSETDDGKVHTEAPEIAVARKMVEAVDRGGIPLNPARVNAVARGMGLTVDTSAKPEATIARIREALPAREKLTEGTVAGQKISVNLSPTPEQKKTGQYTKGRVKFAGLDINIENFKNSQRDFVDPDGKPGKRTMKYHYGEFDGTKGADGDAVDVGIVSDKDTGKAFVINQTNPRTGEFDEVKVLLGAETETEARDAYNSNYQPGWMGLGEIHEVSTARLKEWLDSRKSRSSYKPKKAVFSRAAENPQLAARIESAIAGDAKGPILIGMTPQALLTLGMPETPMVLPGPMALKMHFDHGMTKTQIFGILNYLADPLMVFKSDTEAEGNFVVLTRDRVPDGPLMLAVRKDGVFGTHRLNVLTSGYGRKEPASIGRWIDKGLLIAAAREEAAKWVKDYGMETPAMRTKIMRAPAVDAPPRTRRPVFSKGETPVNIQKFLDEYYEESFAHPLMSSARVIGTGKPYSPDAKNSNDYSVVELSRWGDGIHVSSIVSLEAGKKTGTGSRSLKMITDLADKHGVTMYLHAKKIGTNKETPSTAKLKAWYKRNGFEVVRGSDQMMRKPQTAASGKPVLFSKNDAFNRWFSGSKIIDEKGKPLVLYHGSKADNLTVFKPSKDGFFGGGIYLTSNKTDAEMYTSSDKAPLELFASIKRPYYTKAGYESGEAIDVESPAIDFINELFDKKEAAALREKVRNHKWGYVESEIKDKLTSLGHDGIVIRWPDGLTHVVAFEPEQVKSATNNRGTFDPKSKNILFSKTPAFERWFEGSKVVDSRGKPLEVYHGAPDARFMKEDGIFKNHQEKWGREGGTHAFWFSKDRATAKSYADERRAFDYQNAEPAVIPAYLQLRNPLIVEGGGKTWREAQARGKTRDVIDEAMAGGHDGVIIRNVRDDYTGFGRGKEGRTTDTYVVFSSNQIKSSTSNNGNFDPKEKSILFSKSKDPTKTKAFKQWFGKSKIVDEDDKPLVVYHGTTGDFESFDRSLANPESDFGAGLYFSNTQEDVSSNYSGEGPDLTQRIELLKERLEQDVHHDDDLRDKFFEQVGKLPADAEPEEIDAFLAKEAREQLKVEHAGMTLPVYLKMENPAIVGGDNETHLDYEQEFDEETEDYGEEKGSLVDFIVNLRSVASRYDDGDVDSAVNSIMEEGMDGGIGLARAVEILNADEQFGYHTDDTGKLVSHEIIREALERTGFDGIIDHTVDVKFGSQRRIGKKMEGMNYDTVHYIVFQPNQVKSAIGNNGKFDQYDERITYRKGVAPVAPVVSLERGQDLARQIAASVKRAPPIAVYRNVTELPPGLIGSLAKANDAEGSINGFFYDGVVYAFTDAAPREVDFIETVYHEMVGHYGLRSMLDDADYTEIMEAIWRDMPQVARRYASRNGLDVKDPEQRLIAAEEVIAYTAGRMHAGKSFSLAMDNEKLFGDTPIAKIRAIWKAFTDAVKRFFAKLGGNIVMDEAAIQRLAREALASLNAPERRIPAKELLRKQAKAGIYYSAVLREVEGMTLNKASGTQWWNTISKRPGVKPEELQWLGLEDWLKAQSNSITREKLLAFINANQIKVGETVHGGKSTDDKQGELDRLTVRMTALGYEPMIHMDGEMVGVTRIADGESFTYDADQGVWVDDAEDPAQLSDDPAISMEISNIAARIAELKDIPAGWSSVGGNGTRYDEYTLPGGENYRELLMTLPRKPTTSRQLSDGSWITQGTEGSEVFYGATQEESLGKWQRGRAGVDEYSSSHFSEKNILAHIRFDERTDADGRRVLFVEEIQSDWHQAGRKRGYKVPDLPPTHHADAEAISAMEKLDNLGYDSAIDALRAVMSHDDWKQRWDVPDGADADAVAEWREIGVTIKKNATAVPDAPFKTTWSELAFKRALRWATENGFDRLAWTTGKQQADRYGLRKHVGAIGYKKRGEGVWQVAAWKPHPTNPHGDTGPSIMRSERMELSDIEDYFGVEIAKKIANGEGNSGGEFTYLEGMDLEVGGEGMIGFYDDILPRIAGKLTKKWGGKIGETRLPPTESRDELAAKVYGRGETYKNLPSESKRKIDAMHRERESAVHSLDITPEMRDAVKETGFPLFSRGEANGLRDLGNAIVHGNNDFSSPQPSKISRAWNYLRYKVQDKFIDLLNTQREVQAFRGVVDLPPQLDAYLQQTLYHGRAEEQIKDFEKAFEDPLIELIKHSGYEWQDISNYLYARHAPERNARMAEINGGDDSWGSGMTDHEASEVMMALESMGDIARLDAIGAHVDRMNKWIRDRMVMEGLETQETIDAWEATYKYYVPLKGWAEESEAQTGPVMPKKGKGFDTGGKLTKAATGRKTKAATILANIGAQARATLILAEKAKVGRALYDFVSENPAPDHWTIDEIQYTRTVDPTSGLVREGVNPQFKLADNVVRVKIDGVDKHITFNPHDERMLRLAAAMKNLSPDQIGPILGFLHGVNRYLSMVSTSFNPEFVITNALRDVQTAMVNLGEEEQRHLRTKVIRDWRKAARGIWLGERESAKDHEWKEHWERFKKAGAKVGWIDNYKDSVDLEKMLQRKLGPANTGQWTMDQVRKVGRFVDHMNGSVENAIRLSTFVNLTAVGVDEQRAAAVAKNLTVNFNRKGEAGTFINSLYLFANASIQGTARFAQFAASKKGLKVLTGIVVAGIAMDLLNRFVGGDDDDDENRYDKIPDSEKERNIIIMLPREFTLGIPGTDVAMDVGYLKIPMPYGYNVPYFMGGIMGRYVDFGFIGNHEKVTPGADAAAMFGAVMGSFSPIGDTTSIAQFLLPTLADPFVQLDENRAWHGGKIYPDAPFDESPPPDSSQAFGSTPLAYKEVAQFLNSISGGTEVTPGNIDISPETMQHWVDFAGGGLIRFATSVINAPMEAIKDPLDLEAREVAFLRRVVGTVGKREDQELFYSHVKEVQYAKSEIDAVYKIGVQTDEGQERMAFIAKKYPVATMLAREMYPSFANSNNDEDQDKAAILRKLYQGIKPEQPIASPARPRRGETSSLVTRLSRVRQEIRRLEARDGLPAAERRKLIEEQRDEMEEIVTKFNKRWSEVSDSVYGAHKGKIIGQLGPLVDGKSRREQVASLKAAGYSATADLIASLPPTPDRLAMEYFSVDAARS